MRYLLSLAAVTALAASGCMHTAPKDPLPFPTIGAAEDPYTRADVADRTCEATAAPERDRYLSAIQRLLSDQGTQGAAMSVASRASVEHFRDEVNGAYFTVVARCKTHMQCLEANQYNEPSCYMAAGDRKDAERRFADLSYDLRDLERETELARIEADKAKRKPGTRVNVQTNVESNQKTNVTQSTGDYIEDQDVAVFCGNPGNLIKKRCRDRCPDNRCGR